MATTPTHPPAVPIACTLSGKDQMDRGIALDDLFRTVMRVERLPDGYAFAFPGGRDAVLAVGDFIAVERECCAFLTFALVCASGDGTVWLRLHGDETVQQFIRETFVSRVASELCWRM